MDRRPSRDEHRLERHSTNNPNVFDDEYASDLSDGDDFMGVSDGFRPNNNTAPPAARYSLQRDDMDSRPARRSMSTKAADTQNSSVPRRSSIAKPPLPGSSSAAMTNEAPRDPFADPQTDSPSKRPANAAQALMHRASVASTSSFATMGARSSSPSGPSHPYAMYPQGTGVGRTLSVTTSSTVDRSQPFAAERPQHPYALYTQNAIVDDADDETPPPSRQQAIPVGFPGLNAGYHRQIGPDGEEQDIIGPDGHTEQLPPYSRYPEEGQIKATMVAPSPITTPVEAPPASNIARGDHPTGAAASPATSTAPASPVVMAHLMQTPSSQESQQSEKSWRDKNWSEKKRTRVLCGRVPLWLVILLVGLLMIFAIILGAAIGSMISKNSKNQGKQHKSGDSKPEDAQPAVTVTQTMFDASIIPTPTNLAAVVTGVWGLPLDSPEETQRNCITDSLQSNAWSCKVQGPFPNVGIDATSDGRSFVGWIQPSYADSTLQYGVKTPTTPKIPMDLVLDQDEPSRGPALHFQTMYDKIVVVPENFVSSKVRRQYQNQNATGGGGQMGPPPPPGDFKMPGGFKHRNQVEPGSFPWICRWNSTFIEAFIYVNQNSTFASQTTASVSFSSTPTPSTLSTPSPTVPTSSPSAASASGVQSHNGVVQNRDAKSFPHLPRGDGGGPKPSVYPRVLKVEERRVPNSPQVICQQVQTLDDGTYTPRLDGSGNPIYEELSETDPSMSDFLKAAATASPSKRAATKRLKGRDDPSNACHCQWVIQ